MHASSVRLGAVIWSLLLFIAGIWLLHALTVREIPGQVRLDITLPEAPLADPPAEVTVAPAAGDDGDGDGEGQALDAEGEAAPGDDGGSDEAGTVSGDAGGADDAVLDADDLPPTPATDTPASDDPAPEDTSSEDAVPEDPGPEDSAPEDSAPEDSASTDPAPEVPRGEAPETDTGSQIGGVPAVTIADDAATASEAEGTVMAPDTWRAEPSLADRQEMIDTAARTFDLPPDWIAAMVWAADRPDLVLPDGVGAIPVPEATFQTLVQALDLPEAAADRAPADEVLIGAAYARMLWEMFGEPGFLAGYHMGPGAYGRLLFAQGTLPAATQAFVDAVMPRLAGTRPEDGARAGEPRRPDLERFLTFVTIR